MPELRLVKELGIAEIPRVRASQILPVPLGSAVPAAVVRHGR
jgi:hypothetical protein